jgi:hypothetical protein
MKKLIALTVLMSLISCEFIGPYGYKYEQGHLPESPVNLEPFNSEYDDYNSTAPSLGRLIPFCFSTNRNSQGGTFDVIYQPMNVNFDKTSGILSVTNEYANWSVFADDYAIIQGALNKINTSGNEFGPYLMNLYNYSTGYDDFLLMYATDLNGNFDINFVFNKDNSAFSDSFPVKFLNSAYNDLYPTVNKDQSEIYFCSDRQNGQFDIYHTKIDTAFREMSIILSDTNYREVTKDTVLSSSYDDKCPYIFGNTMVFTSNRPGGYGGFDLYYSRFEKGQWTKPTNLGSQINSRYDEYRPILFEEDVDNDKNMMVFSSNRDGGKGGFDLYFVGVELKFE